MYKKRGFTLIELLVVVLIIGILASVALPQYTKAVNKSRMTQAITWARNLRDAERIYFMANGSYTQELDDLDISFQGCEKTAEGEYTCADGYHIRLSFSMGTPSVYVYLPEKYTDDLRAGVEFYVDSSSDIRLCFATPSLQKWVDVCKSYGGTLRGDYEHLKYYIMP